MPYVVSVVRNQAQEKKKDDSHFPSFGRWNPCQRFLALEMRMTNTKVLVNTNISLFFFHTQTQQSSCGEV